MAKSTKKSNESNKEEAAITQQSNDSNEVKDDAGLNTLRDILLGPQAQATNTRLDGLERRILQVKRELSKNVDEEVNNLRDSSISELKTARQELESQLVKQNSDQSGQLHALQEEQNAALEGLSTTFEKNLRDSQNKLSNKIDDLSSSLSEQLLEMQAEFRKRDDDLRLQILTLTAWLDEQKTSRDDLSSMFINMGNELQKVKKSKIADSGNEESE